MLSICIPVYNCFVSSLTECLNKQGEELGTAFEIILIDDFSESEFKLENRKLSKLGSVIYIELEKNLGRSAIRNLFLKYARFHFMLFLDCDSQITNNQFIKCYIENCNPKTKVICGGTTYSEQLGAKHSNFRRKYGLDRESATAEIRQLNPYQHFKTNNFVVDKALLNEIKFDENLSGYGHEDSLFAYRLKQREILIKHIHNPIIHQVTETFEEYLDKTKQAIGNLYFINSKLGLGSDFAEMNKLLRFYEKIGRVYLRIPLLIGFLISIPLMRIFFRLGFINLKLFDFYKLGYYNWLVLSGHKVHF